LKRQSESTGTSCRGVRMKLLKAVLRDDGENLKPLTDEEKVKLVSKALEDKVVKKLVKKI